MIAIIDYGLGNLGSVENMLRKISAKALITSNPAEIAAARALILPGVGHFDLGMKNLRERGLRTVLDERVRGARVPVLGICLGMQLLGRGSEEGSEPGLGWIAGDVKRFAFPAGDRRVVPHMGWSEVETRDEVLFRDATTGASAARQRFYFVHSYHMVCDEPSDVAAWCDYGYRFAAAVRRDNVMGTQFHPEKSHRFGMALLRNYVAAVTAVDAAA